MILLQLKMEENTKLYEYSRFNDSDNMMSSSLEKLVEFLPEAHFDIMAAIFPSAS